MKDPWNPPPTIIECPSIIAMQGVHVAVNAIPDKWHDGGGSFVPGIDLHDLQIQSDANDGTVDYLTCRYMVGQTSSLIFTAVRAGACVISQDGKGKSFTCVPGTENWRVQ